MNLDKYRSERREARTEEIPVAQLAEYFPKGNPLFRVRGLSAAELGRCKESSQRNNDRAAMAAALLGGDAESKAAALKELAAGPDIPDDICQRQEMLAIACVAPVLQQSDAVLLSEDFPTEFYQLTNAILRLTGAGRVLGKPKASGKTKTSGPA